MSLLPPNATNLELAIEAGALAAFSPAQSFANVWDVEECPAELLPWLAWSFAVVVWDDDWTPERKRAVIRSAISVHRQRGTIGAMRKALAALDLGVQISRWFEHGGDPFTFRADIILEGRPLTEAEVALISLTIERCKSARSWLERLRIYLTMKSETVFAAAAVSGERIDIQPWFSDVPVALSPLNFAVTVQLAETLTTGETYV